MGQVVGTTSFEPSSGDVRNIDVNFANDTVILAENIETLNEALETLRREAKPLGLHVSWIKAKIQLSWYLGSCC